MVLTAIAPKMIPMEAMAILSQLIQPKRGIKATSITKKTIIPINKLTNPMLHQSFTF
ncbi:hypothetical protein M1N64_02790 [Peptococcaceae bacterium]|nr:hypothetical protein [Peptococcaceae bacterium]